MCDVIPLSELTLVACHYTNGMERKCICRDNPKAEGLCVIAWEKDECLALKESRSCAHQIMQMLVHSGENKINKMS